MQSHLEPRERTCFAVTSPRPPNKPLIACGELPNSLATLVPMVAEDCNLRTRFWFGFEWASLRHQRPGDLSPEKAGVGGSIPSLATIFSTTYKPSKLQFR